MGSSDLPPHATRKFAATMHVAATMKIAATMVDEPEPNQWEVHISGGRTLRLCLAYCTARFCVAFYLWWSRCSMYFRRLKRCHCSHLWCGLFDCRDDGRVDGNDNPGCVKFSGAATEAAAPRGAPRGAPVAGRVGG